jgi:UrcA family protein
MKNRALVLTATLVTVLTSAIPPAHAGDGGEAHHMLVHFADLDLNNPAGVRALFGRLRGAAEQVCAPLQGRDLSSTWAYHRCVRDALARAVAQVDQPDLSAYYRARTEGGNGTPARIVASK